MKYKNKFVKTFSFLENYGFILSIDPQNGNRLCYKNDYGEIVMSNKKEDIYTVPIGLSSSAFRVNSYCAP